MDQEISCYDLCADHRLLEDYLSCNSCSYGFDCAGDSVLLNLPYNGARLFETSAIFQTTSVCLLLDITVKTVRREKSWMKVELDCLSCYGID